MKTATEAAKELSINESTVRSWAKQFGLPSQKKSGKRIFDDQTVSVLQEIAKLKNAHAGFDTITRVISPQKRSEPNEQKKAPEQTQPYAIDIKGEIKAALAESYDLAEKYARATFEIGQLQERVKGLEQQNLLLPTPADMNQAKAEIEQLKRELATEKQKSWWQKLLGR